MRARALAPRGNSSISAVRAEFCPLTSLSLIVATFVFSISWSGVSGIGMSSSARTWRIFWKRCRRAHWYRSSLAVEEQFYFAWPFVGVLLHREDCQASCHRADCRGRRLFDSLATPLFATQSAIYPAVPVPRGYPGLRCLHRPFRTPGSRLDRRQCQPRRALPSPSPRCSRWLLRFADVPYDLEFLLFNTIGYTLVAFIYAGSMVFAIAQTSGLAYRILCSTFLRYMGLISFTFYLFQEGILVLARRQVESNMLAGAITFVVTVVLATISWRFFEAPCLSASPTAAACQVDLRCNASAS